LVHGGTTKIAESHQSPHDYCSVAIMNELGVHGMFGQRKTAFTCKFKEKNASSHKMVQFQK
jgi:hypothetical protein